MNDKTYTALYSVIAEAVEELVEGTNTFWLNDKHGSYAVFFIYDRRRLGTVHTAIELAIWNQGCELIKIDHGNARTGSAKLAKY